MRREELYLRDILEAADAIERFISGLDEEKSGHSSQGTAYFFGFQPYGPW